MREGTSPSQSRTWVTEIQMKKMRVPGSSDRPTGLTAHRHSNSTAQEGPNTPLNEAEVQSKTYSTRTAHGRNLPSTRDKADLRSRTRNISCIPTKIPSQLVPPCIVETDMEDAKVLPSLFLQGSRSFFYTWMPSSGLLSYSLPRHPAEQHHLLTLRAVLTEQNLQTMSLWNTQQLRTRRSKGKRGPSGKLFHTQTSSKATFTFAYLASG